MSNKLAKELLLVADVVYSFKESKELEDEVKKLKELSKTFIATHGELISEIDSAKEKAKELEDKLKEKYNAWKVKDISGFLMLRKNVLELAEKCLEKGEKLDDFIKELEDFSIKKRDSESDSYKMKYEMIVSTLHKNGEYQKYAGILDSSCAKIITEMKTGLSLLDDKVDDWDEKVKQLAEERGLDWKGLIEYQFTRNTNKKKAGLIDNFAGKIQTALDKVIVFIEDKIKDIANTIMGYSKNVDKAGSIIDNIISEAKLGEKIEASKKVVASTSFEAQDVLEAVKPVYSKLVKLREEMKKNNERDADMMYLEAVGYLNELTKLMKKHQ